MTLRDYGEGLVFALILTVIDDLFRGSDALLLSEPLLALVMIAVFAVPLGWVGAFARRKIGIDRSKNKEP